MADRLARSDRLIVDLGTGDGRGVLALAAAQPDALVLGIDADATSMAEASRRAARPRKKNGLPNALFLASAIEELPPVLEHAAELVTINFPWGSLLRGVIGLDDAVATSLARLPKADRGSVTAFISVTERDGIAGLANLEEKALEAIERRHAANGLRLVDGRPATREEILETRSTWGRRLLAASASRPVWRLQFELRRKP